MVSERIKNVSPSLTLAISSKAKAMKKQGLNVVGFGAGEPDFDTPQNIKNKAKTAIDSGFTKYTPASGLAELKEAVAEKMKRDSGLEYTNQEIIIGCGAKYVIFEIIFSLINPGDEVVIPSPYWLSYPEMVKICGGVCKFIETKDCDDFKITPESLEESLTPKTKVFILNSPSNPTGMVYTKEELEEISKIVEKHDIVCISDEIYEKLVYDGVKSFSMASFSNKVKEKTVVVGGVSKTYAMTGWRIGFGCGSKEIISLAAKLQSHTTSNPTSISQIASIEALRGSQEEVSKMRQTFEKRRDYMVERINKIESLKVKKPQGAFYCFVDISQCYNKKISGRLITNSLEFAEALLEEEKVAVVPGVVFGNDSYVRLSYANSLDDIKLGLDRIEEFLAKLS